MIGRVLRFGRQKLDTVATAGIFCAACALYVRTMAPTLAHMFDDSVEFALVVRYLAVAHPTGYPLYTLIGKLFSFLPVGDVAFRLHLFSAVAAAAAAALLYLAARRAGLHPAAALAAALLLAVSPVFWSQALIAEVYSLNALFVSALLVVVLSWGEDARHPFHMLAILFFVLGLSLTHHRTIVLIFPALAIYLLLVALRGRLFRWRWRRALFLVVVFCLPLVLYLYVAIRGGAAGSIDGTYRNTLQGFISWVAGGSYTVFLSDNPLQQPALSATAYLSLLREQFGAGGLALAVLGVVWLAVRRPRLLALFGVSWLVNVVFVHLYRVADVAVFLIPSFMMAALLAAAGVDALATALPNVRLAGRRAPATAADTAAEGRSGLLWRARSAAALAVACLLPGAMLTGNLHAVDLSRSWNVHNYAVDVLSQPLERDAAIVGILGEVSVLRYYQDTHGMRRDIQTIAADLEEQRLAAVAKLVEMGTPVYLTRALPGAEKTYSLQAVGRLIRVRPLLAVVSAAQPGAMASGATFGGGIVLVDYRLDGLSPQMEAQAFPQQPTFGIVESGGRLRLTLSWRVTSLMQQSYRLTVRLVSPTGRLLWQRDGGPVHDNYPTRFWRLGETVWDVHDLLVPIGTPPGLYDVEIGLYDPSNLKLLSVVGRSGLLSLGPVSIVRPNASLDLSSLPLQTAAARQSLDVPGDDFDYSLERIGVDAVVRGNLQNEFMLYGYGVSGPLSSGQSVDVTLLWQALRPPSGDRVVFIHLVDKDGAVWASQESQPAEGAYPTRVWERGEVVRDVHDLLIPADVPDGDYMLQVGMYDPSGSPLTVLQLTRRSVGYVSLGAVQVHGRQHVLETPPLRYTVQARLGSLARLVGFDMGAGELGRGVGADGLVMKAGDTVRLHLVWQAIEPTQTSYTVFVHLVGPDGRVAGQDDSEPGRGALLTTSWVRNEVLRDDHQLVVPAAAAAGTYTLEVGLYDAATGARLPVWNAQGISSGDSLSLAKVNVERAP